MLFGNCSVETVMSNVQGLKGGVSEHSDRWEIGDRRKSTDKHSICSPSEQFSVACFKCGVFMDILHGCVMGCVSS